MNETTRTSQPTGAGTEPELLDHNYDGIQEFDNPLPGWWVFLFWATVVFSPFYFVYYHLGEGASVQAQFEADKATYDAEQAERAVSAGEATEEGLLSLRSDAASMGEAQRQYTAVCAACHGAKGEGGIGPNLTDEYWIHGGSALEIYKIIYFGVKEKGMNAWSEMPGFDDPIIRKLAAYVRTLEGTNPPNAKPPQGEKVTR